MANSRIELRSEEIQENPYPIYAYMREHEPVCQLADGSYALTREQDVRWALNNPQTFSSSAIEIIASPDWLRPDCRRSLFLLSMDPPEHTKYRSIVNKQFAGSVIKELTPLMERTAEKLISQLKDKECVEFVTEFSYPYIGEIVGRTNVSGQNPPLDEAKAILELRELNTPEKPSPSQVEILEAEFMKQNEYYNQILSDRKIRPRNDIASLLVQAQVDGKHLSDRQMRDALDLFMSAGFHTPAQFLATAMLYLSRLPDLRIQLTNSPDLIPDFIEELLRYDGPTHRLPRMTTCDVVLHGVTIPKGAIVSLVVAAANHDQAVFRDPESFDISRENNRQHMQFAVGPHACIGLGLARAETRIALEVILPRVKTIECVPGHKPRYTGTLTTRGLRQLMVRFK